MTLQNNNKGLQNLPQTDPPDKVWDHINQELDRQERKRMLPPPFWYAAAAVIVLGVSWSVFDHFYPLRQNAGKPFLQEKVAQQLPLEEKEPAENKTGADSVVLAYKPVQIESYGYNTWGSVSPSVHTDSLKMAGTYTVPPPVFLKDSVSCNTTFLSLSPSSAATFKWDFGDGVTSYSASPSTSFRPPSPSLSFSPSFAGSRTSTYGYITTITPTEKNAKGRAKKGAEVKADGELKEVEHLSKETDGDGVAEYYDTEGGVPGKKGPDGTEIKAGLLTAGEINDFAKWKLWEDLSQQEFSLYSSAWGLKPTNRYSIQVTNNRGLPIIDAVVYLKDKQKKTCWTAHTDNTGKAELWYSLTDSMPSDKDLYLEVTHKSRTWSLKQAHPFADRINMVKLPIACTESAVVDVAFVVDATSSMSDEIQYLKAELNDVIEKFRGQAGKLDIRTGSVFYRDFGDEYVTRYSDLDKNIKTTTDFIAKQDGSGGGDLPEAVDTALDVAIRRLSWSPEARARIIFLVLDASPHNNEAVIKRVQNLVTEAAAKGIRIVPVASSGVIKETEFLMRSFALATNGTYLFLTDHSGIGQPHMEPSTDSYQVEQLNKLLLRILTQYTEAASCATPQVALLQQQDTIVIMNGKFPSASNGQIRMIVHDSLFFSNVLFPDTGANVKNDSLAQGMLLNTQEPRNPGEDPALTVYPNPSHGELNVRTGKAGGLLYIADITGKLVKRVEMGEQADILLDLSGFSSGIYTVQYIIDQQTLSAKFVLVYD